MKWLMESAEPYFHYFQSSVIPHCQCKDALKIDQLPCVGQAPTTAMTYSHLSQPQPDPMQTIGSIQTTSNDPRIHCTHHYSGKDQRGFPLSYLSIAIFDLCSETVVCRSYVCFQPTYRLACA